MWHTIENLEEKLAILQKAHYFQDVLFSPQWWFFVIQTIVVYIIWFLLVDKSRLRNILLVGALTTVLALMMDNMGIITDKWSYPYPLFYFANILNTVDAVLLPVGTMLIYQYFRKWLPYMIAIIILSLIGSFVAEPLYAKFDMYLLHGWKYIYSFPIYIAMGMVVKGVTDGLEYLERKEKAK